MKILVLGLASAPPELLFGYEDLPNIRRLMEAGSYGRLESVIPPAAIPGWMCMATGLDPGSLGVYSSRNRTDHSYTSLAAVSSLAITAPAVWDHLAREGKKSITVGVPPGYPPRALNGVSVGCFLTPDTDQSIFTHPREVSAEIRALVGPYPVDVRDFDPTNKSRLRDQILTLSRTQFRVVRHLMANRPWDYFQFVDIGLARVHRGFWKDHDPHHPCHEPDSPFQSVIHDYYRHLDGEIGQTLELRGDDTIVLVVSEHGTQRLHGGFCVNEWLMREGLLVLHSRPREVTPLARLDVDWAKTKVWSEAGPYAQLFLNVKGREPSGVIDPADYESFRDEVKARIEAATDPAGNPLGTLVYKPEEIDRQVKNVAPDLIALFGGLSWCSIDGVGYNGVHVLDSNPEPGACNPAQFGAFILASSNNPLQGELQAVHSLDMTPTLLELAGSEIPSSMLGRSLVSGVKSTNDPGPRIVDDETLIRDQLSGLGYLG